MIAAIQINIRCWETVETMLLKSKTIAGDSQAEKVYQSLLSYYIKKEPQRS